MIRKWAVPAATAAAVAAVTVAAATLVDADLAFAAGQAETVEADPIRCWWRTSVPAVRVGEPFSVVLTCAVLETDSVTVVPNQAELAPNAVQMAPFDVIGGSQGTDLRTADHRFFQYEYRARLVSPDLFGKDVPLPEMKVSYKVRTRVDQEIVEGRDVTYVLPAASVRILSIVPGDAADIRDASRETFSDIDRRLSRASVLRVSGGILMAFAVLAALVSASRLVGGTTRKATGPRVLASDGSILRRVGRELSDLQRARREADWSLALTARLTTALRILAAYALGRPAPALPRHDAGDGNLTIRRRGFGGGDVTVPAWVTPTAIAESLKHAEGQGARRVSVLQSLESVLSRLTSAQYTREGTLDDATIDEALATGSSAVRQLQIDNLWIVRKVHALRRRAGLEGRT